MRSTIAQLLDPLLPDRGPGDGKKPMRPSRLVQALVGLPASRGLSSVLRDRPPPTVSIDCDRRPAVAFLATEMNEQRVGVMFDANAVSWIRLLVQPADHGGSWSGFRNERGPPAPPGTRTRQSLAAGCFAVHPLILARHRQMLIDRDIGELESSLQCFGLIKSLRGEIVCDGEESLHIVSA